MRARTLLRHAPLCATFLSLMSAGCGGHMDLSTRPSVAREQTLASTQSAAAGAVSQPGFFPLTIGNRWTYQLESVAQLVPNEGEAPPPQRFQSMVYRSIGQPVEINGREYLAQTEAEGPGGGVPGNVILMRQNATGLYEWAAFRAAADRNASPALRITVPAGRSPAEHAAYERAARRLEERMAVLDVAAGRSTSPLTGIQPPGVQPGELTRLQYPLQAKARWPISVGPPFQLNAEVIGAENLVLPPGTLRGYRIRLEGEFLGTTTSVYLWYGPSGFLQLVAHAEVDAVDQTGAVIGRYIVDQREWLTEITLASSSPIAGAPFGPGRPRK